LNVLARIHEAIGGLFIVACLLGFLWALAVARRHRPLPALFWGFLRKVVGGLLALQIVTGLLLLAFGARVPTSLHWVYAVLILLGVGVAEMLRPGSNLREALAPLFASRGVFDEARAGWMLLVFVLILALRAFTTGLFGF
jgi:hypothetical protein